MRNSSCAISFFPAEGNSLRNFMRENLAGRTGTSVVYCTVKYFRNFEHFFSSALYPPTENDLKSAALLSFNFCPKGGKRRKEVNFCGN